MFNLVNQPKAPRQIIDQIRNAVLEGKIKPGNRLSSEKELMDQFGVSKATLREALRALEYLGLIETRKGAAGGVFISEVDMETTRQSLTNFLHFKNLSIHHLSEIRRNLEPYSARLAAAGITEEDLSRLKNINETCRVLLAEGRTVELRRNEVRFHRIIANVSRNPILILILDFIENMLEDVKNILKPDYGFSKSVIEAHERICQALSARDQDWAAREMLEDVSKVEESLIRLARDNPPLKWT
ncbi:MAG: FadR/GntR family transcriptional regulator [Thermodesulfobacteriota bacterium]